VQRDNFRRVRRDGRDLPGQLFLPSEGCPFRLDLDGERFHGEISLRQLATLYRSLVCAVIGSIGRSNSKPPWLNAAAPTSMRIDFIRSKDP
jgi:hypothetical protein